MARASFTSIDATRFGPWAIVTGSSSGIGKAFAQQLAASGINVVLVARRRALLEEVGRSLRESFGVQYRTIVVDLRTADAMSSIRAATDDLDVGLVISNAGGPLPGEFLTQPLDTLLGQVQLDVVVPLQLVHHFAQKLSRRGRGGLLLISAMGAVDGLPLVATTSAGKAFVESFGRSLHVEFTKSGLNTTVLIVGPTDTRVLDMLGVDRASMPVKPQSADATAAEALAALIGNRPTHLSGWINRLVYRVLPSSVTARMARSMVEQGLATLARKSAATATNAQIV